MNLYFILSIFMCLGIVICFAIWIKIERKYGSLELTPMRRQIRLTQHTEQPKIKRFEVWKRYHQIHNRIKWTNGKSEAIGISEF